jgi:hypothetical protein
MLMILFHGEESSLAPMITAIKNKFDDIRVCEVEKFRNRKMKHFSDEDFKLFRSLLKRL